MLIAIGVGARPEAWAGEVLASRDRTRGGVTADAGGLYLLSAEYDERYGLPPELTSGLASGLKQDAP